jgi:hypothetical protein
MCALRGSVPRKTTTNEACTASSLSSSETSIQRSSVRFFRQHHKQRRESVIWPCVPTTRQVEHKTSRK